MVRLVTRDLLVFFETADGINTRNIGEVKDSFSLNIVHQLATMVDAVSGGKTTLPAPEAFDFYGWAYEKLELTTLTRQIPAPGIVLAVERDAFDDTYVQVQILKAKIEHHQDTDFQSLLRSFTEGERGRFVPTTYDVFLSYSNRDHALAEELRDMLSERGMKCFMAGKDLTTGSVWEPTIRNAIRDSQSVVILLTPNSVQSPWLMCEAGACWALEKPMFPATTFVDVSKLPAPIQKHQAKSIETVEQRKKLIEDIVNL